MKKTTKSLFLAILFCLTLPQLLQAAEEPLRFGVFPYKSPKVMMQLFMPIARQLEEEIGRPVHLSSAADADQYNKRAMAGEYDLIWPCNTCYFQIHAKAGYEAVVRGYPSFNGAIIVRKDSGISELAQLQGRKVAAVGKGSYGGYKFFHNKMKEMGYTIPGDISVSFLGKLDSIIFSVVGRQYDAGTIRQDALASSRFDRVRDQLAIIYSSTDIPQFPFAVKPGMDQGLVDRIVKVLSGINKETPQGKAILKALKIQKFVPCTDSDYDDFRKVVPGVNW